MSDFVAAKILTFAPRKKFYFSVHQKIMFFSPAKKFAAPPQKFLRSAAKFAPAKFAAERKILFCAAKFARKNAQNRANGFAYHGAKNTELRAKKNFAPQTAQFARKQKFPKMETLIGMNLLNFLS